MLNAFRSFLGVVISLLLLEISVESKYGLPLLFFFAVPVYFSSYKQKLSWCSNSIGLLSGLLAFNYYRYYWLINAVDSQEYFLLILVLSVLLLIPYSFLQKRKLLHFGLAWITIEYLHMNLDTGFPLKNLGIYLSKQHTLIQWYELTGPIGGSVWIISINTTIIKLINKSTSTYLCILFGITTIPICLSFFLLSRQIDDQSSSDLVSVAAIGTSINTRLERVHLSQDALANQYIDIISSDSILTNTDLIVFPEVSLHKPISINSLTKNKHLLKIQSVLRKLGSNTELLIGAIVKEKIEPNSTIISCTTEYNTILSQHYNKYNTMISVTSDSIKLSRSKGKLVPFFEYLPYCTTFKNTLDIGMVRKGQHTFSTREETVNKESNTNILPLICYESLFSNFVAKLLRQHRFSAISISLNEGWFDHTRGSKWFLRHGAILAISHRKSIIRSSNLGFCSITNRLGQMVRYQKGTGSLTDDIQINNEDTIYTKNSVLIELLVLLGLFVFLKTTN